MPVPRLSREIMEETLAAVAEHGGVAKAGRALGLGAKGFQHRAASAKQWAAQGRPDWWGDEAPPPGPAPADPADMTERALRDDLSRLRRDLNAARRDQLDWHRIRETVLGLTAADMTPHDWSSAAPQDDGSLRPMVPVLMLTDWHSGEVIRGDETRGYNTFDLATAERRIARVVRNATKLATGILAIKDTPCPGMKVILGGDMVSGRIHSELAETNQLTDNEAILFAVKAIVWALRRLADTFGAVDVEGVPGNHGRQTHKPHAKRYAALNSDTLIYAFVERELAGDPRIKIRPSVDGDALFKIYGHSYLATHGDALGVKGGDGIIGSVGPIMRGSIKTSGQYDVGGDRVQTLVCGHWHQSLWLPRVFVSGSLKGWDEFARRVLRAPPARPQQSMWMHHPQHGPCYKIEVECEPPVDAASTVDWREAA